MSLQVTGSSGTINWCGKTWNLPGDSGLVQEVCPTFYRKGHVLYGPANPSTGYKREIWQYGGYTGELSLRRAHGVQTSGFYVSWRHRLFLKGGNRDFFHWRGYGSVRFPTPSPSYTDLYTDMGIITPNSPARGTWYDTHYITDNYFGSHTTGGITYTWSKGTNW
jgi:hypothetical protein